MLARTAWIEACEFRRESNEQTLSAVESVVRRAQKAVILVDLDHTVYRNAPRTRVILRDLLPQLRKIIPNEAAELIDGLEEPLMGFSLRDTFHRNGLYPDDPKWAETLLILRRLWWPIFFSDGFLSHDAPYSGAPEYCRRLAVSGARLIYLSARNGHTMLRGTEANLRRDGFPLHTPSDIWLKLGNLSDRDHKITSVARARTLGTVVASFENEPANTVGLVKALPEAIHVFADTVCSESPAVPIRGLFRLTAYL